MSVQDNRRIENNRKKKKRIIYICGIALILIALIIYGVIREKQNEAAVIDLTESTIGGADTPTEIMIHVAGAVNKPGLITLKTGDRVADAINAAGGLRADADTNSINLAEKVEDEQKIVIRSLDETADNGTGTTATPLININTADKTALMTLPGIGEVIAGNIIDYREKNGGFSSLDEIKNVNRIGDKLFDQIKDHITI